MKQNLILKYFTEICQIPHITGQEKDLALYIADILREHKCKVQIDKLGNVYAYKTGKLEKPGICFQAHLDMVGDKIPTSNHNFKTDPINYYEDRGWIKAKETTLGADNAAGIAIILALFTDPNVIHGPIEAVFTVQEETTTIGAMKLSNDWIKSLYLINVDSEDDTEIIVGSGWSCDFSGFLPIQRQARDDETTDLSVKIMNGLGGHSATTIHGNHANIIVETFNILKLVSLKYPLRIIDVKSSTQLNAIPSYCDVILNIKRSQVNHFKQAFLSQFNLLVSVHQLDDKHLSLVINNVKGRSDPLTLLDSVKLVNLVCAANHGLNSYNLTFNIPNTSTNLGKLIIGNDEAQLGWMQRSSNEYELNKLNTKLNSLFALVNGKCKVTNITAGLTINHDNRLATQVQQIAKTIFQHDMTLQLTHAVLEIGEIAKHYPQVTAISLGPNIKFPHTPRETVEINSIFYIFDLLKETLKTIK